MIKNWMILGDEAFNSKHEPVGVIELSPEELDNWQDVAWRRFANIVNNNEKVREMVFNSNYFYLGAVFSKRSGVTKEDVDEFADALYQNIDDLEYYTVDFSVNPRTDDGTLILSFGMYDEEKLQKLMPTHYTYIKGDIIVPVDSRSFSFFS
jgi:hypothetical protein